ncbi:MAG: M23 family metallopeptidase [Bacteroidota bacterium]
MKWFSLDFIKKSSIYITPNFPETGTTRYKLSLLRSAAYFAIYTIVAWFVLIFILSVTPLKDFLFVLDNQELKAQREKINELQNKVETLTNTLQVISNTNERMKYAIELAMKDSVKSNDSLYDKLKKPITKKIEVGGNIFLAFQKLINQINQETKKSSPVIFQQPANGILTNKYDPAKGHLGLDFGMKTGTPVYASAGGLIIFADYTLNDGYMIIVEHDDDYYSIYKHCSSLLVKQRDFVNSGELIALSGNSGVNSTGPHLHFEVWHKGKTIDPSKLIFN